MNDTERSHSQTHFGALRAEANHHKQAFHNVMCGMTQSTLNNIINTGSKRPQVDTIKKICDGLGIGLGEFFSADSFKEVDEEFE